MDAHCKGVGDQPACKEPLLRDLSGALYYEHCEDNSFFCWSTNIVLVVASIIWCAQECLIPRSGNAYRASVYFAPPLIRRLDLSPKAVANAFASAYHYGPDGTESSAWKLSTASIFLNSAFLALLAIALVVPGRRDRLSRGVWLSENVILLLALALSAFASTRVLDFSVVALSNLVPFVAVNAAAVWRVASGNAKETYRTLAFAISSVALYLGAGILQQSFATGCAQRCPEVLRDECPLLFKTSEAAAAVATAVGAVATEEEAASIGAMVIVNHSAWMHVIQGCSWVAFVAAVSRALDALPGK